MVTIPRKDELGMLNTWYVDLKGFITVHDGSFQHEFRVRFTSDYGHESISITDEDNEVQFLVPFEKIQTLIYLAREESWLKDN